MKKKIGIVAPFQHGDLITTTSVLKYKDELWPDCGIVWFCNEPHSDALKFQDIEIRHFPHGWDILENDINGEYAERVKKDKLEGRPDWEDWSVLINYDNRLKQELRNKFYSIKDLDEVYFPVPWMLSPERRHEIEYPNISKKVFGVPADWEWHPYLKFSQEEYELANEFMDLVGEGKRVIIESFAGSGQSRLNEEMIVNTMNICSEYWEDCVFIFASHKFLNGNESYPAHILARGDTMSCAQFTVRQCALIAEKCDLMISVSSGITVASSAWYIRQPPTLQFCGSEICSTRALSHTKFELVTADDKPFKKAQEEYYFSLMRLLSLHK